MGRPPLLVGTFRKIGYVELPSGEVQARFRDFDGHTPLVSKAGRSRAAGLPLLIGGEGPFPQLIEPDPVARHLPPRPADLYRELERRRGSASLGADAGAD